MRGKKEAPHGGLTSGRMASSSSVAAVGRAPVSHGLATLALALLLGLRPVTTDIYLPALLALTRDLGMGMGMGMAQLTMSALILAFGIAQLCRGPLADRLGPAGAR